MLLITALDFAPKMPRKLGTITLGPAVTTIRPGAVIVIRVHLSMNVPSVVANTLCKIALCRVTDFQRPPSITDYSEINFNTTQIENELQC